MDQHQDKHVCLTLNKIVLNMHVLNKVLKVLENIHFPNKLWKVTIFSNYL